MKCFQRGRKGGSAGSPTRVGLLCAAALPWFLLVGCATTTNMRLGERAERQGRYHVAYDYYCDEAKLRPSSGAVRTALARVAPPAARHYQREAARAADAGNHADAWKLYMRALSITPDDSAIARLIKMLEQHHATAIAPAKTAWMALGGKGLAVASATSPRRHASVQVADEHRAGPAVRTGDAAEASESPHREPHQAVAEARHEAPPRSDNAGAGAARATLEQLPQPRSSVGAQETRKAEKPVPKEGQDYLMTAVLSVKDDRFPRKTHTVDDIHVKLKDTDGDPEDADLDVYLGSKRVKKARDLRAGQGIPVRGRSGKVYDLVVIAIIDRTESVRVGVRPHVGAH